MNIVAFTANVIGYSIDGLRSRPIVRGWILGISTFTTWLIVISWVMAANSFVFKSEIAFIIEDIAPQCLFFSSLILVLTLLSYTNLRIKGEGMGTVQLEIDSLRKEREKIQERLAESPKPDVMDTIQLNLNQLSEYYAINKSQARSSFRFSVFAVVTGFITLIIGIWIFYFKEDKNIEMAIISGIAGSLSQFIGGAYFFLYRKSLEQLNFFFNQLVKMQDTMLSVQ